MDRQIKALRFYTDTFGSFGSALLDERHEDMGGDVSSVREWSDITAGILREERGEEEPQSGSAEARMLSSIFQIDLDEAEFYTSWR